VSDGKPVKSLKKTSYSQAKTVWPLPNHEVPFFPEFPIRSRTSEHSFNVCISFYQIHFFFWFKIKISFFMFQVISVVSSGAYGKVLQVIHKEDAKNYAMKIMSKSMVS
jgi:hypothetical protein